MSCLTQGWSSVPGVDLHAGFGVVPSEVNIAAIDLDLPLMAEAGIVGTVDDFHDKDVLAFQAKECLPCSEMGIRVSKDFEVAFGEPVMAQAPVQDFEVSLAEIGYASGPQVVDTAEVGKGVVGRLGDGELLLRPLRGAGVIEFGVDHSASREGQKGQEPGSNAHKGIPFENHWRVTKGAGNRGDAQALVVCKNTAGGGMPSVLNADRGQARLQMAPIPSLSNSGRVGADRATRPVFSGGQNAG